MRHPSEQPRTVSAQDIESALIVAAQLVDLYGEAYWPIFERLDQELERSRSRAARLKARLDHQRHAPVRPQPNRARIAPVVVAKRM